MKALVLTGEGVNCEHETALALQEAGFESVIKQLSDFESRPAHIHDYSLLALPGGFSYGDDLGSGKIFAQKIKKIFGEHFNKFIESKKPVIGICNGFQTLMSLGVFNDSQLAMSLDHNVQGHFINRWEYMNVSDGNQCIWTKGIKRMRLPIRHGEGRVVFSRHMGKDTKAQLELLRDNGQVVLTYEEDPNGSTDKIAGVCDKTGLVFGLMPHPEAATKRWHFPGQYIAQDCSLGHQIFNNAYLYVKENLA